MPSLNDVRADILLALYEKHATGLIDWTFDQNSDSAQATVRDKLEVHLDRSKAARGKYKVWFFDNDEKLDTFLVDELAGYLPPLEGFDSFESLVDSIFSSVKDAETVKTISPMLDALNSLGNK